LKKLFVLIIAGISALTASSLLADTLELANGEIHEGSFIGSSNGIVMFDTGAGIEAFPQDQVVGLYFSDGVATAESLIEADTGGQIIVPAGTRLVIRTTDNIDSGQHSAGHRFRGQLEGALVVDGVTVVPRGSFVHGRIAQSSEGGRVAGSSSLAAEFTDIMINDQLIPISTGTLAAETGGEAARTVGRTARAAAVGGLMGGSSGARTGARVGVGASILTSGSSINIPRGTIVETTLSAALTVTL
jgi:hypothetical protein